MTARIYDLPLETIEEILRHADPIDVASLSQCSKLFYRLVYHQEDQHLWRCLYLRQPLDDPRKCMYMNGVHRDPETVDWQTELQALMHARTILENTSARRSSERRTALATLIALVECVPPLPEQSNNLSWVASYLKNGTLIDYDDISGDPPDEEEAQLQAKLHTYYGRTPADELLASRVRCRAYIYDLRHYTWATEFGPFLEDGRVNWMHLQAIQQSMSIHVHSDDDTAQQVTLFLTQISPPIEEEWKTDWAGVAGVWTCGFCFCDHMSLAEFNRAAVRRRLSSARPSSDRYGSDDAPDPSFFEDPENGDVCRAIVVKLHILSVSKDPKHPQYPRIHFGGNMGQHNTSTMAGHVYMSDDNQVRWRFRSGEHLNPIWSSEGVQVGGLRSSFGVLGTWTTTVHDVLDPVGPFWLRRVSAESVDL